MKRLTEVPAAKNVIPIMLSGMPRVNPIKLTCENFGQQSNLKDNFANHPNHNIGKNCGPRYTHEECDQK